MNKFLAVVTALLFLLPGVASAGDSYRSATVFTAQAIVSTDAAVTAGWDWSSMDCDGPFSIDYAAVSATGTPDVSIIYQILNEADDSTWGVHTEWDATDNGTLTAASNTAPGNVAQGLPFAPPVNSPGRFSVFGVASNPADTLLNLTVQCYRRD